jgi:2-oxoglutarate ferredoxin oxidoreductase subunit alpha
VLTVRAFNLAEQFRCPVFLASNKEIGMTRETIDLGSIEKPEVVDRSLHEAGPFLPFGVEQGQQVPAFLPIGGPVPVRQTSSTHGAHGFITTDPAEIQAGVERLRQKIDSHAEACAYFDLEPSAGARTLIVTYGVTARAARAAIGAILKETGRPIALLVLKTLWPVPEQVLLDAAQGVDRVLVVEMNLGQYIQEVRRVLCGRRVGFFGKMNGQLITPAEIVKEVLRGDPSQF